MLKRRPGVDGGVLWALVPLAFWIAVYLAARAT